MWDTARKQAFDYVGNGLRKWTHSTMFIIAKDKQFKMFEVPGSQMVNGATWTSLRINNNGTQHLNKIRTVYLRTVMRFNGFCWRSKQEQ